MIPSLFISLYFLCLRPVLAENMNVFSFDTPPKHFLITGVVTGRTTNISDKTRFVGLDLNYIIANDGRWFGLASDAIYDATKNMTTISFAPRLGWYVFGMDGGLSMRISSDQNHIGYHMRGIFTLGYVSCFYRYTLWSHSDKNSKINHQTGIVLKMPVSISKKHRSLKGVLE